MAQINKAVKVQTHEGGRAVVLDAEAELRRSVMSCMLWEGEFYENGVTIADRILHLVTLVDARIAFDIAVIARTQMYLRHVPLLIAVAMCKNGNARMMKNLLPQILTRPDQLTEFMAMYWAKGKTPIAAGVKKGLALAFEKFQPWQLAKYNRDTPIKLRDVMFMVHPRPQNIEQNKGWKKLAEGTLEPPDTWEVALSGGADKRATFTRLLSETKLGALAFLRNLRNMKESGVDERLIRMYGLTVGIKQVLPFRFIAAARVVPAYEDMLEEMMMRSLKLSEKRLNGVTVILVDISGSMFSQLSRKSDMLRADAACGLAMVARELCDEVKIYSFAAELKEVAPRHGFALRDAILASQSHGCTYLGSAVRQIDSSQTYDRLIVITDEQSHDAVPAPKGNGYMINVASAEHGVGYRQWKHIDGFSESIFKWILEVEN